MPEHGLKTEQPTEKRLRDAQTEGRFAKAPDISVVFVLVGAFAALLFTTQEQAGQIAEIATSIFSHLGKYALKPEAVAKWSGPAALLLLSLVMPMGVACMGAAALAGAFQSRFQLTPDALKFDLARLNPVQGFQRIFSAQGWVKLALDALKLIVVAMVLWGAIKNILSDPLFYTPVSASWLGGFIFASVKTLLGRFIMILSVLGALFYVYQLRKTQRDLMMTRQEVKEEHRSSEGDPALRAAMRHMARRLMQKQMLSAVPTADVVVTNPTHFAVALKYERGTDRAPMVLAKGERAFALRLKAIAAAHGVPMVENKPVARMLFKHGRVGKTIPVELYQVVAEILAFVYRTHRYYFHEVKQRRLTA
jgi:flagellar biosynthesis protein FlhB